jgi:hypothetical protein
MVVILAKLMSIQSVVPHTGRVIPGSLKGKLCPFDRSETVPDGQRIGFGISASRRFGDYTLILHQPCLINQLRCEQGCLKTHLVYG